MRIINEIIQELTDISNEYNSNNNDIEIRNLKLELLIQRIEAIELNMNDNPFEAIDKRAKDTFNHLLLRYKLKAVISLKTLQDKDKRSFNHTARILIKRKLFFTPLFNTMIRTIKGYIDKNNLNLAITEFEIFIEGDATKNE